MGLFVGVFTLRLKGLYPAIVTLGLVFIVAHVLVTAEGWTGRVGHHLARKWRPFRH